MSTEDIKIDSFPSESFQPREVKVMGYRLHPMTSAETIALIGRHVHARKRLILAHLNLHGMAQMFESPAMADVMASPETKIIIDGRPLTWLHSDLNANHRVTSLDYFDALFQQASDKGWRINYVGSAPETLDKGMNALRLRFPNLEIYGIDGYFDIEDGSASSKQSLIIEELCKRNADILIVGMGMPRQERWISSIREKVSCPVIIPVGAYLDYQAGALATPPRWLGPLGLEWAYRLSTTPRLLGRYLVEPFVLAGRLMFQRHPLADYWNKSKVLASK